MLRDRRYLALIPARGGSKGLPGKSLTPIGGRPLIAWSIAQALATPEIDRVLVTTDRHGAYKQQAAHLATAQHQHQQHQQQQQRNSAYRQHRRRGFFSFPAGL